jgi:hypothetical protein
MESNLILLKASLFKVWVKKNILLYLVAIFFFSCSAITVEEKEYAIVFDFYYGSQDTIQKKLYQKLSIYKYADSVIYWYRTDSLIDYIHDTVFYDRFEMVYVLNNNTIHDVMKSIYYDTEIMNIVYNDTLVSGYVFHSDIGVGTTSWYFTSEFGLIKQDCFERIELVQFTPVDPNLSK